MSKGGEKMKISELLESYNGSIDIFIEAFSLFSAQKSSLLDCPAKNDFLDLHHLLYLGNDRKCFIVTDDKMVLRITKQSVTIDNFNKINGR